MTDFAPVQEQLTAIVTAHTCYAKASFEANKAYFENLVTLKAPDECMQLIPILHQSELMMYGKDVMERTSPGLRSM